MTKNLSPGETLRWLEYFGRMATAAQEVHPADVLESAARLIAQHATLREALAELVAVKDLKGLKETATPRDAIALAAEYSSRKPAAWEAARAALDSASVGPA